MDELKKYFDWVKDSNCKGTYSRFSLLAAYLIRHYPELGELMFDLLDTSQKEDWELEDEHVLLAIQAYRKENNL